MWESSSQNLLYLYIKPTYRIKVYSTDRLGRECECPSGTSFSTLNPFQVT